MGAETKESLAADGDSGEGLVDLVKVAAWMDEHTPEAGSGPLTATRIPGGATNAVFLLDRGGVKSVLRRPPRVPRPDNEKVLAREARVLGALNGSDVPAPRFMGHCADPAVNGTSFYIMSFAEGWVALGGESAFPPAFQQPGPEREKLAYELVDGIIKLANVDYKAVGLEGFGKPDNFLERQVDRWLHQLESYRETDNYQGRDLPGLAYVSAWLKDNLVKTPRAGIIHGDYGFANAIFAYGDKAKLVAMIDWELSTVGDPLLDLGWVTYGLRSRHDPPGAERKGYFNPEYFPTREDICEYYSERAGLPIDTIVYYQVLSQYKLAILLERKWAEGQAGAKPKEFGDRFGELTLRLLRQAEAQARAAKLG